MREQKAAIDFGVLVSQFRSNGTPAHPVVGYDRWDDPAYIQALKNIRTMFPVMPCIRLDREAIH